MTGAQTIVADVVPARERGRYQGLFGSVFGVTSVLGPLIGGFFVDNLSWRWVFYVNLPIGIVALAVVAAVLPGHLRRAPHKIDYLGTVLLAGAATGLVTAHLAGRDDLRLVLHADLPHGRGRGGVRRRVHLGGEPGRRAGPAAAPVPQPGVLRVERGRLRRRVRDVRGDRLPAPVHADRQGRQPDHLRAAAAAADGRPAGHLDHHRAAGQQVGPLPDLPDLRHRDDDDRPLPAVPPGRGHQRLAVLAVHAGARGGHRRIAAGPGRRGAELGQLRRSRHGHRRRDVLPVHRRLVRHGHLRRRVLQRAGRQPGWPACTGCPCHTA